VGVVLVSRVVEVHDLGSGAVEDRLQINDHVVARGVLDHGALKAELDLARIIADQRRLPLLEDPDLSYFFIRVLAVGAGPRAAAAVGHGDAAEPGGFLVEAMEDAVQRHELDVVLVCADREVGRAAKSLADGRPVRNIDVGFRVLQLHHRHPPLTMRPSPRPASLFLVPS